MMGLGKPQRLAKFEVAGFIYCENIREFVFKNWDKPKWETHYYLEKLILPLDSQTQCATVVELRLGLQQMGDFYEKPHFAKKNFKFREAVK